MEAKNQLRYFMLIFLMVLQLGAASVSLDSVDTGDLSSRLQTYVGHSCDDAAINYLSAETAVMTARAGLIHCEGVYGLEQGCVEEAWKQCDDAVAKKDEAAKAVLTELLRKDADYQPGMANNFARMFMRQVWKGPEFNMRSEENFGMFVQGLLSKMEPDVRQYVFQLGQKVAEGMLEKHLLDLKYNAPVVAVAVVRAVLEEGEKGCGVSPEGLGALYARLAQEDDVAGVDAVKREGCLKESFELGQSYAEQFETIRGCWRTPYLKPSKKWMSSVSALMHFMSPNPNSWARRCS